MNPTQKSNAARLHDLKSVYTDFKIVLSLLKAGYKFDDDEAPELFTQIEKSLAILATEITHLKDS